MAACAGIHRQTCGESRKGSDRAVERNNIHHDRQAGEREEALRETTLAAQARPHEAERREEAHQDSENRRGRGRSGARGQLCPEVLLRDSHVPVSVEIRRAPSRRPGARVPGGCQRRLGSSRRGKREDEHGNGDEQLPRARFSPRFFPQPASGASHHSLSSAPGEHEVHGAGKNDEDDNAPRRGGAGVPVVGLVGLLEAVNSARE